MTTHQWKEIRQTTGYRTTDHPSGPVPLLPSRADGATRQGVRRAPTTREEYGLMDSVLVPVRAPETGTMPAGEQGAVGLGVIGLGAFGRFCLEAYVTMPGIRVVALADPDPDALAAGTILAPQALAYADPALLMGLPQVEVVTICAPPDRHLALVLATRLLGPAHEVHTWDYTGGECGGPGPRRLVTTAHPCGAVASVYHAFDTRSGATGCTVLVGFEEGEARLDGWMPRRLSVTCAPDRLVAVSTLLSATGVPLVSSAEDSRALLTLLGGADRRSDYLEMVRTTLRVVLAKARGQGDGTDLASARAATATALAAELAALTRTWVRIDANGPLEATA